MEFSDVLVQIVDARNPLLFRCEDLERYVKEVDKKKLNLILCNKADFLTYQQRRTWAKYFDSINVSVVFFSALKSTDHDDEIENEVCVANFFHLSFFIEFFVVPFSFLESNTRR